MFVPHKSLSNIFLFVNMNVTVLSIHMGRASVEAGRESQIPEAGVTGTWELLVGAGNQTHIL